MVVPNFYSAVYAIIKNENWEILFSRRKGNYKNWFLQLPAWHIEWNETIKQALIREIKEEINLDINENDLKIIHISHRVCEDRVYFDIYIEVMKCTWKLNINEPEKCSELKFINIDNLPNDDFMNYDINCLKKAYNGEYFSDIVYL